MPRTIQCIQCQSILNLPASSLAGKKLTCPCCGLKFRLSERDASSESTVPGIADATSASNFELDKRRHDLDDVPMPQSDGDLRETFDLPLMSSRDLETSQMAFSGRDAGEAATLFDDPVPAHRRKKTAGDARQTARRCSHCGGFVPQGMSLCAACGTDQETGMRVGFGYDLDPPPAPPAPSPPIHVLCVGGFCAAIASALLIRSVVGYTHAPFGLLKLGWILLGLLSVFSVVATIEFIRGKTIRLLLLAIALGSVVDVAAMIALPSIQADVDDPSRGDIVHLNVDDPDAEDVEIRPLEERLDIPRIMFGVVLLVACAGTTIYLLSPPAKKYVHAHTASRFYD